MTAATLILRQARLEQLAFWRNPDSAFFTFALPLVLLALLGMVNEGDTMSDSGGRAITYFVPGILAFAVIVAAYGSLAGRVAILRSDGVLKRVRTTPLSPAVYLGGHLASTLATAILSALTTIGLGWVMFDVAPRDGGAIPLVLGLSLGVVCFAALGLAVTALIRSADAAGPVTNGTYLPLALVSGTFDPTMEMPGWLERAVAVFPIKPLTDVLQSAYSPGTESVPVAELAILAAWAGAGVVLARRFFRWQP